MSCFTLTGFLLEEWWDDEITSNKEVCISFEESTNEAGTRERQLLINDTPQKSNTWFVASEGELFCLLYVEDERTLYHFQVQKVRRSDDESSETPDKTTDFYMPLYQIISPTGNYIGPRRMGKKHLQQIISSLQLAEEIPDKAELLFNKIAQYRDIAANLNTALVETEEQRTAKLRKEKYHAALEQAQELILLSPSLNRAKDIGKFNTYFYPLLARQIMAICDAAVDDESFLTALCDVLINRYATTKNPLCAEINALNSLLSHVNMNRYALKEIDLYSLCLELLFSIIRKAQPNPIYNILFVPNTSNNPRVPWIEEDTAYIPYVMTPRVDNLEPYRSLTVEQYELFIEILRIVKSPIDSTEDFTFIYLHCEKIKLILLSSNDPIHNVLRITLSQSNLTSSQIDDLFSSLELKVTLAINLHYDKCNKLYSAAIDDDFSLLYDPMTINANDIRMLLYRIAPAKLFPLLTCLLKTHSADCKAILDQVNKDAVFLQRAFPYLENNRALRYYVFPEKQLLDILEDACQFITSEEKPAADLLKAKVFIKSVYPRLKKLIVQLFESATDTESFSQALYHLLEDKRVKNDDLLGHLNWQLSTAVLELELLKGEGSINDKYKIYLELFFFIIRKLNPNQTITFTANTSERHYAPRLEQGSLAIFYRELPKTPPEFIGIGFRNYRCLTTGQYELLSVIENFSRNTMGNQSASFYLFFLHSQEIQIALQDTDNTIYNILISRFSTAVVEDMLLRARTMAAHLIENHKNCQQLFSAPIGANLKSLYNSNEIKINDIFLLLLKINPQQLSSLLNYLLSSNRADCLSVIEIARTIPKFINRIAPYLNASARWKHFISLTVSDFGLSGVLGQVEEKYRVKVAIIYKKAGRLSNFSQIFRYIPEPDRLFGILAYKPWLGFSLEDIESFYRTVFSEDQMRLLIACKKKVLFSKSVYYREMQRTIIGLPTDPHFDIGVNCEQTNFWTFLVDLERAPEKQRRQLFKDNPYIAPEQIEKTLYYINTGRFLEYVDVLLDEISSNEDFKPYSMANNTYLLSYIVLHRDDSLSLSLEFLFQKIATFCRCNVFDLVIKIIQILPAQEILDLLKKVAPALKKSDDLIRVLSCALHIHGIKLHYAIILEFMHLTEGADTAGRVQDRQHLAKFYAANKDQQHVLIKLAAFFPKFKLFELFDMYHLSDRTQIQLDHLQPPYANMETATIDNFDKLLVRIMDIESSALLPFLMRFTPLISNCQHIITILKYHRDLRSYEIMAILSAFPTAVTTEGRYVEFDESNYLSTLTLFPYVDGEKNSCKALRSIYGAISTSVSFGDKVSLIYAHQNTLKNGRDLAWALEYSPIDFRLEFFNCNLERLNNAQDLILFFINFPLLSDHLFEYTMQFILRLYRDISPAKNNLIQDPNANDSIHNKREALVGALIIMFKFQQTSPQGMKSMQEIFCFLALYDRPLLEALGQARDAADHRLATVIREILKKFPTTMASSFNNSFKEKRRASYSTSPVEAFKDAVSEYMQLTPSGTLLSSDVFALSASSKHLVQLASACDALLIHCEPQKKQASFSFMRLWKT